MSIKINNVTIGHFRSFNKVSEGKICRLDPNVNIFAGENNVGKTNVLRAINLFFNPHLYNYEMDANNFTRMQKTVTVNIKIDFVETLSSGETFTYKLEANFSKDNSVNYTGKKGTLDLNESQIQSFLSKVKVIYMSVLDEGINLQMNSAFNDMLNEFFMKKSKIIKENIEQIKSTYENLQEQFDESIQPIKNELDACVNEISPNMSIDFVIKKFDINKFLEDYIDFQFNDEYKLKIESRGSGMQRLILILVNLHIISEIYNRKDCIVLIDEPEAFLYPKLEMKMVNSIKTNMNKNIQFMLASHSREMFKEIENFKFYNVYQEVGEPEYISRIKSEAIRKKTKVEEFNAKSVNKYLDNFGLLDEYDYAEQVLIVEGETDEKYITKALNTLNLQRPRIIYGKDLSKSKKHLGRGASAIPNILESINIYPVQRDVYILLDGDGEGKETLKKINSRKNLYGNLNIKAKLLPEMNEIEDIVYTADSLKKALKELSELNEEFARLSEIVEEKYPLKRKNYMDSIKVHVESKEIDINLMNIKSKLSQQITSRDILANSRMEELVNDIAQFFCL